MPSNRNVRLLVAAVVAVAAVAATGCGRDRLKLPDTVPNLSRQPANPAGTDSDPAAGGGAAQPGADQPGGAGASDLPALPDLPKPVPPKPAPAITPEEFERRAAEIQEEARRAQMSREERIQALEAEAQAKLAQDPNSAAAFTLLGQAAYARGDHAAAVEHYQRATVLNPADAPTWNLLGNALRDQGQSEQAEAAYRKALALDPKLVVVYTNLVGLLQLQGRAQDAITVAVAAVHQHPDSTEIWRLLGDAAESAGHWPLAVAAYESALQLAPNYPPLLERLDQARVRLDQARAQEGQGP